VFSLVFYDEDVIVNEGWHYLSRMALTLRKAFTWMLMSLYIEDGYNDGIEVDIVHFSIAAIVKRS